VPAVLAHGRMEITGRLVDASNATLFGTAALDGVELQCVYKPVRGERPLWDFPDGTLAGREVAAFLVSKAAGFHVVPHTILRDGPFGPGMVQVWVDTGDDELVDICAPEEVPPGWLGVLRARGDRGEPAVLVHADVPALQAMAAFDAVANNADRKGGHVLAGLDGHIYGVDHGLCLHSEHKLRTVLWGWVDRPLPEDVVDALKRLRTELDGGLRDTLGETQGHLSRLNFQGYFPAPDLLLHVHQFRKRLGEGNQRAATQQGIASAARLADYFGQDLRPLRGKTHGHEAQAVVDVRRRGGR